MVVPLAIVVLHQFVDRFAKNFLEQYHPLQARFLEGSNKAGGVGIKIRREWRQFH